MRETNTLSGSFLLRCLGRERGREDSYGEFQNLVCLHTGTGTRISVLHSGAKFAAMWSGASLYCFGASGVTSTCIGS